MLSFHLFSVNRCFTLHIHRFMHVADVGGDSQPYGGGTFGS